MHLLEPQYVQCFKPKIFFPVLRTTLLSIRTKKEKEKIIVIIIIIIKHNKNINRPLVRVTSIHIGNTTVQSKTLEKR